MANRTSGGRIVPILISRQNRSPSPSLKEDRSEPRRQASHSVTVRSRSSMVTRNQAAQSKCLELPSLHERGLYALPTEGDGNCLYYALSDQLYGDFSHAHEIRSRLADHIAANKGYFMSFASAGGELRRGPKRAAALAAKYSSRSSPSTVPVPTSEKDMENSFDIRVSESRRNGTWGGAEEIQAFCQLFGADVKVYTTYGVQCFRDVNAPWHEERQVFHIAFHDFNHYSSVRHTHGPHRGLPCIPRDTPITNKKTEQHTDAKLRADKADALQTESEGSGSPASGSPVMDMATPWKISAIQESLGGRYDREAIVEMLQHCRGNIDRAFANLLGECMDSPRAEGHATASKIIMKSRLHPSSSRSSSPYSTASKRSADNSESEEELRPTARQTRREKKRRTLPDVTVGIAFGDSKNDLVSLKLRVGPEAGADDTDVPTLETKTESNMTAKALHSPTAARDSFNGDGQTLKRNNHAMTARNFRGIA